MKKNNFGKFTNLYEISKTLRFELKPVGETQKLLNENKVFNKDKIVNESYNKIKPYLDKLHIKFIEESLKNLHMDFLEVEEKYLEWQKETDKNKKNKFKKELFGENGKGGLLGKLRKNVSDTFMENGKSWKNSFENKTYLNEKGKTINYKIKGEGYKILLSDTNLDILSEIFNEKNEGENVLIDKYVINPNYREGNGEDKYILEKQNLFKSFTGFTTYFTNFNHSRENFYKDDGKAGRIATRIIDENLIFFLKNKKNFDEKYKNKKDIIDEFNKVLKENYGEIVENLFNLEYYNNCYTGKQIEYYNQLIGELNSVINFKKQNDYSKFIQEKKEGKEVEFKKQDYPIFKELYKQILSEITHEQKYIEIDDFDDIKKYLSDLEKINIEKNEIAKNLINSLIEKNNEYDFDKIYITKLSLNTISAKFFGSDKWFFVQENLLNKIGIKNKKTGKIELPDFIKLNDIKNILELTNNENEEDLFKTEFEDIFEESVFNKFLKIFCNELNDLISENEKHFLEIKDEILNNSDFSSEKNEKEKQVEIIKKYLDSSLNIYRMMKYFALEKGKQSVESEYQTEDKFYNEFKNFYTDNEIIGYYNEFRNYLTKKPFSTDKIKLNFENGTLIDGWDKNKEPDNYGTILRKDGKYFLLLQIYGKKNIFYKKKGSGVEDIKEAYEIQNGDDFYEKMDYKFLPDPKKMFPKVFFAKNNLDLFNPSNEILKIKENETFKIGEKFNINDLYKVIDYYKESIKKYTDWKIFDFDFSDTKKYKNLSDFYKEVETGSYNINFRKVSENYIFENLKNGNIYLFEIYNKDFAEKKSGKENLHTMYFKGLFEENNLKNVVLKLNGQAEIFRREASIDNLKIDKNRKTKNEIIENKRYTQDKLFFHCPIKLNFARHEQKINNKILEYISNNKDINIIGIDRGEKHLAYYSVIDRKGNILKDKNGKLVKGSFNVIDIYDKDGEKIDEKDYYKKLVDKETQRKEARGSWKVIGNIKDLKHGYISQVVHKLAELIIEYNAIIVFEDLNFGFKRGRQKIERQIYQKLEKALIEKLNYLTFKDKKFGENGHYLSAYQLTSPFETFEKVGKQTGVIFYTDPSYTSSTCPKCGFKKDLYLKYSNLKNARGDLEEIDSITYNGEKFIFEYKGKTVFSDRDRKKNSRNPEKNNEWDTIDINVTKNLEELFKKYNIDYLSGNNLILLIQEKNEKDLYKDIFYNFNAVINIRNSTIGDNSRKGDFICCPCCDFDSRKENTIGIENGDDNGAFNIARKGIIILNKINEALNTKKDVSKIKWEDMIVKKEDWSNFTQNKF